MTNLKLRIRHPSGAEFEAEGPADLILSEKTAFLNTLPTASMTAETGTRQEQAKPAHDGSAENWTKVAENTENGLRLRVKHQEIKAETAALILLAADKYLNSAQQTSAIELSKALKKSGYQPGRLDRLLIKADKNGWLRASGTKRNRAYQATARGLEIAWLEARKLTE